ncbi:hypothetical protein ABZ371_11260, partial [Streptomyces sp. NPDC005899]
MTSSPRTAYTPLTPVYRAVFCDLRTDQVLDVLPLTETKFDDYIGKAGSLSATVPLPDAAPARPGGGGPGARRPPGWGGGAGAKRWGGGGWCGPPARPQ